MPNGIFLRAALRSDTDIILMLSAALILHALWIRIIMNIARLRIGFVQEVALTAAVTTPRAQAAPAVISAPDLCVPTVFATASAQAVDGYEKL